MRAPTRAPSSSTPSPTRQPPYDQLTVVRTRTGSTRLRVGNDLPPGYYAPPDEIESWCCTQEWTPAGWVHDRACVMRLAAR